MEKESKEQRALPLRVAPPECDFPLQWGSCKRLRCVKVREEGSPAKSDGQRRATSRINRPIVAGGDKDFPTPRFRHPARLIYSENQRSRSVTSSPEKEDRCYAMRGSLVPHGCEGENGAADGVMDERGGAVALPRFFISLSNKEKEEDFMAMKGCKLPQRPKKRSKYIKKCILVFLLPLRYLLHFCFTYILDEIEASFLSNRLQLVSPGTWLPDLSQERYEAREKKGSRKRKRGLKGMSLESDSG